MKTVIIEYARISPAVLANRISNAFHCLTNWKDIDEDYFEFSVYGCTELAELEDVLAEYVQYLAFFYFNAIGARTVLARVVYYTTRPRILSSEKFKKFAQIFFPKFVHFFCAIAIDFAQRLWYYNYSKREVARPSNEVSDAVGKSQRTTRKS